MQDYHTIPFDLTDGENSQAFFAYDNPNTLVIFVHGFKGSAIGTWSDFPEAVVNEVDFSKVDFIFYGYSTLEASAAFHAAAFKKFLVKTIEPVKNNIIPASQGLQERSYSKIILVAHSLGALIVRQAIISACKNNYDWLSKVSLLLFAPAHTGARVQKLAKEVLSGWGALIPSIAKYQYPVYEDLEPDSQFIKTLIDETKKLLANNYKCNIAKKVVWAEKDRVVSQINFCDDPDPELIYNKGHINVCKPDSVYVKPVEILKDVLNN